MRVSTAFNRLLGLEGASVEAVAFANEGIVVSLRLRRRRRTCSRCGQLVAVTHDTTRRRWRHLDLGGTRCFLEASLRRVRCPDCGVRVEAVAFARAGARHTRAFEQLVAWLAQQLAKTALQRLLRIGWRTVGRICARVVRERLAGDRFEGLRRIGIDEVSYRRGHRYLTLVLDHDSGRVVWARRGRGRRRAWTASWLRSGASGPAGSKPSRSTRALYRLPDPGQAPALFEAWLEAARGSGRVHFQRLAATLERFRTGILAAVELGLSNGRLEGLNSKVRLLSHRSFGFHSAEPLIALVYLCCGGLQLELPLR